MNFSDRQTGAGWRIKPKKSVATVVSKDFLKDLGSINLKDFGAVGNGIKDDTSAIFEAIQACPEGGTVFFPPGIYLFSQSIVISKTIKLKGAGAAELWYDTAPAASKLLKAATLNGPGIRLAYRGATVEGLSLDGQSGNGGDGISVEAGHCLIRGLMVIRQGRDGIRVGTDGDENANLWYIDRVNSISNGRHGFHFHSGSYNANAGTAVHTSSIFNQNGFHLERALSNTFLNALAENNIGLGFYFGSYASRHVLLNAYPDSNTLGGFYFESATRNNVYIPSPEQSITDLGININLANVQLNS
jgi:hypothetical protein